MKLALQLLPDDVHEASQLAAAAEALGADALGVADTQASFFRDCYITLTEAARATSSLRLGPMVTNPTTRHPLVTASALATLHEVSGGRAICGVGTGYSAVKALGLPPAKQSELAEYVTVLRRLLAGAPAEYAGETLRLGWASGGVPVLVAGNGFRAMETAGAVGDGALFGGSLTREALQNAVALVRDGARQAGRSPDEVELWCFARCGVAATREEALHSMRHAIASAASHVFKPLIPKGLVPADVAPAISEFQSRYDVSKHLSTAHEDNVELMDSLGIRDYVADAVALVGTVDDCREKLAEIEALGISGVLLQPSGETNVAAFESVRGLFPGVPTTEP